MRRFHVLIRELAPAEWVLAYVGVSGEQSGAVGYRRAVKAEGIT